MKDLRTARPPPVFMSAARAFFLITLEPRLEGYTRLCTLNTSPPRNRPCPFMRCHLIDPMPRMHHTVHSWALQSAIQPSSPLHLNLRLTNLVGLQSFPLQRWQICTTPRLVAQSQRGIGISHTKCVYTRFAEVNLQTNMSTDSSY